MLRSVVNDLSDLEGVELWITRDQRLDESEFPNSISIKKIRENYINEFVQLCNKVDAVLTIAPESDNILEILNRCVLDANKVLLGSDPDTVKICASKSATTAWLAQHRLAAVETVLAGSLLPDSHNGWIVKPDQGAGSEQVIFSDSKSVVNELTKTINNAVIQPFLTGIAASLSLLCKDGQCVVIGYNEQMIKSHDSDQSSNRWPDKCHIFQYQGTSVNSLTEFKTVLDEFAASVVQVFPGLWGYVGLDFILMQDKPVLLEINPRLTTSYCGLRESTGLNPAALILGLLENKPLVDIQLSGLKTVDVLVPAIG